MSEADVGFYGYVPTTTDPGVGLVIVTVAICVLLNALLPCFVACGRHWEKRKEKDVKDDPWAIKPDEENVHKEFMQHRQAPSIISMSDVSQSIRVLGNRGQYQRPYQRSTRAPSVMSFGQSVFGQSVISAGTVGTSVVNQSVIHGMSGRRGRTQRRFRRAMERKVSLHESGQRAESFFRFDNTPTAPAPHPYPTGKGKLDNDDQSFLSKMDTDEVSVKSNTMDADNEDFIPKQFLVDEEEVAITCCGADAWWKLSWVVTYFDRIVALAEYDFEMRKIMKLTLPFASQALFTGLLGVLEVAIVGKQMGTAELSAYVIVDMLVNLTNEVVGGFWNALTTLCCQAYGAKQNKLIGQYVQMSLILYISFSIPFMILWWTNTYGAFIWLGFDEATAEIGQNFANIYVFSALLEGISETIHGLLDVIGLENYSTVMGISEDILSFVFVLNITMFAQPKLWHIGMVHISVGMLFMALNLGIIWCKGWFKPYMSGMIGSFSLRNYEAVWLMCKTALALSLGFLLTDGEWEILTLLASFLGPAEVAAWSILGTLWGAIEDLTEAIGDAAEVRCGFLLGWGRPTHAQVSAYKSMLIATIVSFFVTSILFMMGEDLATWVTKDPVLQNIIIDLLPLFGLGNITMTVGTVSWTLLGAQGRYRHATTVAFAGSWLVTIPLSCLASISLNLNLSGQTAAVVLGYMVSGTVNAYFLFRSDWEKLSRKIIESHQLAEETPNDSATALPKASADDDVSLQSLEANMESIDRTKEVLQTP